MPAATWQAKWPGVLLPLRGVSAALERACFMACVGAAVVLELGLSTLHKVSAGPVHALLAVHAQSALQGLHAQPAREVLGGMRLLCKDFCLLSMHDRDRADWAV